MNEDERREAANAATSVHMARSWEIVLDGEFKHVDARHIPEDFRICAKAVPKLLARLEKLEGVDSLLDGIVAAYARGDDDEVARQLGEL